MNFWRRWRDASIERRANYLAATILDLQQRYPQLRKWSRDDLLLLGSEVTGVRPDIARKALIAARLDRCT